MTSYISTSADIANPRADHVWRDKTGKAFGTVELTDTRTPYLAFDDPAVARALAAACEACAEAMEALPPGVPEAGPEPAIDMGRLSLPAEVQEGIEPLAAQKPGGSLNPTADCGYTPRKPEAAAGLWFCRQCREFHEPAKDNVKILREEAR